MERYSANRGAMPAQFRADDPKPWIHTMTSPSGDPCSVKPSSLIS